ncbi:Ada metal-binding domain-containing protein, partial [Caballeronia sp. M23-90]
MKTNQETAAFADAESRWNAMSSRDASADGAFFYAVCTTGVFCRPSCTRRRK